MCWLLFHLKLIISCHRLWVTSLMLGYGRLWFAAFDLSQFLLVAIGILSCFFHSFSFFWLSLSCLSCIGLVYSFHLLCSCAWFGKSYYRTYKYRPYLGIHIASVSQFFNSICPFFLSWTRPIHNHCKRHSNPERHKTHNSKSMMGCTVDSCIFTTYLRIPLIFRRMVLRWLAILKVDHAA